MSLATITESTRDAALLDRISAAIAKEAISNPQFGNTPTGALVLDGSVGAVLNAFVWPVAVDYETEYAYAVDEGNPDPGGDPAVITDANISAAVQAHWPPT